MFPASIQFVKGTELDLNNVCGTQHQPGAIVSEILIWIQFIQADVP